MKGTGSCDAAFSALFPALSERICQSKVGVELTPFRKKRLAARRDGLTWVVKLYRGPALAPSSGSGGRTAQHL